MATLSKNLLKEIFYRFEKINIPKTVNPPKSLSKNRIDVMVSNTLDKPQEGLEKIRGTNNLSSVATLLRGFEVGLSVGLVYDRNKSDFDSAAIGSGFMIAPNLLITNHHVIEDIDFAKQFGLIMNYQRDLEGNVDPYYQYKFDPEKIFYTNNVLDFTIVSVEEREINGKARSLKSFGYLKLLEEKGKIAAGEFASLIEHPNGKPKQVVLFENSILYDKHDDFLLYSTDTDGGASGSPVFNYDWVVVALHHAGVPESLDRINATDGNLIGELDFPRAANEGIRISAIMADLKANYGTAYNKINEAARAPIAESLPINPFEDARQFSTASTVPSTEKNNSENIENQTINEVSKKIEVTTMNNQQNVIRLNIPLEIHLGTLAFNTEVKIVSPESEQERVRPSNLNNRSGYSADFLSNFKIELEKLYRPFLQKGLIAPTLQNGVLLNYTHFSLVMHKIRKMCIITGVNIDGDKAVSVPRNDNWRFDERIDSKFQLGNPVYSNNDLDRGHMVRREDPNWGPEASIANDDTFRFTNACPQHKDLNQKTWLSLEDYVLKNTKLNDLKVSVFTGPILDENYVLYREALVPVQFYKIVAMIKKDGRPSVTGYVLTQKDLISGLERVRTEFVFGEFKTYQVSLGKIEEMTGLDLGILKPHDPLKGELESVPREIGGEGDLVL